MSEEATGKAKGGKARAAKLSPEERKSIAQSAAEKRWGKNEDLPQATHMGVLKIGDAEIPCAVLKGGQRVLTQEGFLDAIGRARKAKAGQGATVDNTPAFLAANNLKPYISNELLESTTPIKFRGIRGTRGFGYKAELLPKVCTVYLEARDTKALLPNQRHVAEQCEILIRGLAHTGIIALVDEATGFQADRDKDELQKFLALYLSEERLKWAKMFPDEYYKQLFRLWGWNYSPMSVKRPRLVGRLTNQLVYEKLPANALEELRRLNPVKNKKTGRREAAHFQHLSPDIGQSDLRDHLLQLIAVMRVSANKGVFQKNFSRAFPGANEQMDLFDESED
jgi:hypothetical protein